MGLCQNSSWIWWVLLFTIFLTEGLLIASNSFGFSSDISSSFIHFAITRRCAYVSSLFCDRKKNLSWARKHWRNSLAFIELVCLIDSPWHDFIMLLVVFKFYEQLLTKSILWKCGRTWRRSFKAKKWSQSEGMALLCCRGTGRPVNCRSAIAYMSEESGDIFHIRFSGQFVHNHGISRELVDVWEYSPLAFTSYLLPIPSSISPGFSWI